MLGISLGEIVNKSALALRNSISLSFMKHGRFAPIFTIRVVLSWSLMDTKSHSGTDHGILILTSSKIGLFESCSALDEAFCVCVLKTTTLTPRGWYLDELPIFIFSYFLRQMYPCFSARTYGKDKLLPDLHKLSPFYNGCYCSSSSKWMRDGTSSNVIMEGIIRMKLNTFFHGATRKKMSITMVPHPSPTKTRISMNPQGWETT